MSKIIAARALAAAGLALGVMAGAVESAAAQASDAGAPVCADAWYGDHHANFCRSVQVNGGGGTTVYVKIAELSPGSVAQALMDGKSLQTVYAAGGTWSYGHYSKKVIVATRVCDLSTTLCSTWKE